MRRALPEDVPQLVLMMGEFYAESAYVLNQQRAAESFAILLGNDRLGSAWFIQAEGQDVGYVVVTLRYSMEHGGVVAFVDDMFIRPPFRGQGLGTAALAEVRGMCAEGGVRALSVETGRDNSAAEAVYRKVGFVQTDRQLLVLELAPPTHEG